MDAQEFRSLQEAYMEVVENQQLDEGYKKQDLMKQIDQSNRLKSKGLIGRLHKKVNRNTSHKREYSERDARYNRERPEDQKRSKLVSDNNAKKKSFPNRLRRSDGQGIQDSYDYYDIILSHLLDEGYAETPEAAEVIMVNMSEGWRGEIMEGMTMKDFKANRRKLQRKEASDDAKKRGHVDKFTGKPYGTEEAASRRKDIHKPEKAPEREARRKFAEDPD